MGLQFADAGGGVNIVGTHTPPSSGGFAFQYVALSSPTAIFSSAVAGTAHLILGNAAITITNGYTFNLPNWTGKLESFDVNAAIGTADGYINNSGGSTIAIFECSIGSGTTNIMTISGPYFVDGISVYCPVNFITGSSLFSDFSTYNQPITLSNNSIGYLRNNTFTGGPSAAITMSSSGAIELSHAVVSSSNNPAITGSGAGILTYSDIVFLSNASFANTLTLATVSWRPYAQAIASTNATKVGTCSFKSSQFAVDNNGFVSINGSGVGETITGNSGGALSPTAGNWNLVTANSTVKFVGSVSTLTQDFRLTNLLLGASGAISSGTQNVGFGFGAAGGLTSGSNNVAIGYGALNVSTTQSSNVAIGNFALLDATTGTGQNVAIGQSTLPNLLTGANNTVVGQGSGGNYTSSETNNIILGYNISGTNAESNVIRIGNSSNTACYVTGIDGVNVGSVARVVTEASNQLGTAVITAGSGITITPTANVITIANTGTTTWTDEAVSFLSVVNSNYFATAALTMTLPAAPSQGDIVRLIVDTSGSVVITANTGQKIRMSNGLSSSAGSQTNSLQGDSATLVYRSSDTTWIALAFVGTWTPS